jgi:predicted TIM-barrel fold metal-dependent hydrolase
MDKLIIVSGDSHATVPPSAWSEYVDARYHSYLPEMYQDQDQFVRVIGAYSSFSQEELKVIDRDGVWASKGYSGAWDLDRRLAEMDREGIAAELVYPGDPRALLPLSPLYHHYPQDAFAAGARAYNRFVADTFGSAPDRVLLVGAGAGVDIEEMTTDLDWLADHGFVGTYAPGFIPRPDLPPLYAGYFDPFWSRCEAFGLTVVVHAGYGMEPCEHESKVGRLRTQMEEAGRSDVLAEIMNKSKGFFSLDLRPRQVMWQMMLGGVFDRHPGLRLLMTEVRGDWLPATLHHLDASYERTRSTLPAKRRPSEYWQEHCLVSLSFVHRAEVPMRHEIGLDRITFGRDYPHREGTWPNTTDWLADAFGGVPADEVRLMLGENAIHFFGLDRTKLSAVAATIGPPVERVTARTPDLDPRMVASWDARGGYLKPREELDVEGIDAMLLPDIATAGNMCV